MRPVSIESIPGWWLMGASGSPVISGATSFSFFFTIFLVRTKAAPSGSPISIRRENLLTAARLSSGRSRPGTGNLFPERPLVQSPRITFVGMLGWRMWLCLQNLGIWGRSFRKDLINFFNYWICKYYFLSFWCQIWQKSVNKESNWEREWWN